MKILDFINNEIAKNNADVYETCSMIKNMSAKKMREKMFEETRLKNILPYAVDRNADVYEEGLDSAVIILNAKKVKNFNKKLLKYTTHNYAVLYVSKYETKVMAESDNKEQLLDAYACAVSKGIMYANDTQFEYNTTYNALKEILEDLQNNTDDTDNV